MSFLDFAKSAGGGSLIGSLATGLLGRSSAKSTNQETERLSSTAHQRATKDLRLAGLNPILSATGGMGSGASTPQLRDPMESATKGASLGASSALALRRANQEIKNLEATESLTKEQKKAIKYGVPGKTVGTGIIDELLGITGSNSAKSVNRSNKKSNFNLKEYEKTTPSQEKAIQKLLNNQRKRK